MRLRLLGDSGKDLRPPKAASTLTLSAKMARIPSAERNPTHLSFAIEDSAFDYLGLAPKLYEKDREISLWQTPFRREDAGVKKNVDLFPASVIPCTGSDDEKKVPSLMNTGAWLLVHHLYSVRKDYQ